MLSQPLYVLRALNFVSPAGPMHVQCNAKQSTFSGFSSSLPFLISLLLSVENMVMTVAAATAYNPFPRSHAHVADINRNRRGSISCNANNNDHACIYVSTCLINQSNGVSTSSRLRPPPAYVVISIHGMLC
jgi:hypothetical protein